MGRSRVRFWPMTLKFIPTGAKSDVRYKSMSRGGTPWPKADAINYHAQFGLPDKCRAIKGLYKLDVSAFGPAKQPPNITIPFFHAMCM